MIVIPIVDGEFLVGVAHGCRFKVAELCYILLFCVDVFYVIFCENALPLAPNHNQLVSDLKVLSW